MSSDAAAVPALPAPAAEDVETNRHAFRIGVGLVLAFVLAELAGTAFFFLPPMIAVQLLAQMRQPPGLRQAVGLVALTALVAGPSLFLSAAFASDPLVYLLLLGLVLYLGFYLDSAGKPVAGGLLLLLTVTVPLVAVQSVEAAAGLAAAMIGAVLLGLLSVWLGFAVFPAPVSATAGPPARTPSPRRALLNTLLLLPPLLMFMIDGRMTFVAIIVIVTILRQSGSGVASRAAFGLMIGNLLGGLIATIAYGFVALLPALPFFLLVVLAVGLAFGGRIAARTPTSPIFVIALVTFVILLGIGVSPIPSDTSTAFVTRLVNVMLAGAYAVAALSLIGTAWATSVRASEPA